MQYGLAAGILWAVDTVILSVVLGMEPFVSMALSAVISAAIHDICCGGYMLAWIGFRKNLNEVTAALHGRGRFLLLAALLGGPIGMLGYLISVENLGAGLASVLSVIFPAVGALMSRILLKDRLRWFQYVCMVIAIACIAIMLWTPDAMAGNMLVGLCGSIVCILGWASEGVICSYALKDDEVSSGVALAIREITSGTAYAAILVVVIAMSGMTLGGVNWLVLMFLAALAGTLSYACYYKAIDILGTARAMSLDMTYSVWTPILCAMLLGQEIGLIGILLTVCVVACSVVAGNKFDRQ